MLVPIKIPKDSSFIGKIFRLTDPLLANRCYLVESKAAKEILTNHFLVGTPLVHKSHQAVKDCLTAYSHLLAYPSSAAQVAEVVPLSGALTYDLLNAYFEQFHQMINRCFIGIRRFQKPDGSWDTQASYSNFEGLSEETNLVFIGDTIATGVTMTRVIQMVQAHIQSPVHFIIISIAGSFIGAQRIIKLEKSLQSSFKGTTIHCFFTQAFFGLETNGTDMPILHPDTITTNEFRDYARSKLGDYLGRHLCSVLDWGKRTNSPQKHLEELNHVLLQFQELNKGDVFIQNMLSQLNSNALP